MTTLLPSGEFSGVKRDDDFKSFSFQTKKESMNDSSPVNENQAEPLDRREARRQRRASLIAPSGGSAWVMGLILILLGTAFLMQNFGVFIIPLHNWWALFILIPAVGAFDSAVRTYRQEGNLLTAPARGSLLLGLALTLVTATFLLELSWALVGPVLLIFAGLSILLNPKDHSEN
jgi:hypothetical protein